MDPLVAKSNYYHQMDVQQQMEKQSSTPKSTPTHWIEHQIFCDQMGIIFPNGIDHPYKWRKQSYLSLRKKDYRSNRRQYFFVLTTTSLFFFLQIVIGAIQTALGATKSPHNVVTIFGAVATIVGGILAYVKSRGQPNRARQLMNSLRKVVEEIEFQEIQLRNPEIKTTAKEAVDYVNQLYEDARSQAETNYPDFWSTAGSKATRPGAGNSGANQPLPSMGGPRQIAPASSTVNRPPSYIPATQSTSSQKYTPKASDRSGNALTDEDQSFQAPDPAAHIPGDGGIPLKAPDPAAHIHASGGGGQAHPQSRPARIPSQQNRRYMNERV